MVNLNFDYKQNNKKIYKEKKRERVIVAISNWIFNQQIKKYLVYTHILVLFLFLLLNWALMSMMIKNIYIN
jgi:hypothetical protein